MNKIILFCASGIGKNALEYFGEDRIECFCDNNPAKYGSSFEGKPVISPEELINNYSGYFTVVCTIGSPVGTIIGQIKSMSLYTVDIEGIKNWIEKYNCFDEFWNKWIKEERYEELEYRINSNTIIDQLNIQIDYLKNNVDITKLKPTTGKEREKQLRIFDVLVSFDEFASRQNLKYFISDGTLLGAVRHKGYIPWDDDLDTCMMRSDYNRMISYFEKENRFLYQVTDKQRVGKKEIMAILKANKNKLVAFRQNDFTKIMMYKDEWEDEYYKIDIFPFDFYSKDFCKEKYLELYNEYHTRANKIKSNEDKAKLLIDILDGISEHSMDEDTYLFIGIETIYGPEMIARGCDLIASEDFFPLKTIEFEGKMFPAPRIPEKFFELYYEDIMSFPSDFAMGHRYRPTL